MRLGFINSTEAHQCLVKLLSTYTPDEPEYKNYAVMCGRNSLLC